MTTPAKVMVVLGTRPEAVKLVPVISALKATDDLQPVVVATGQHRSMLDEVLTLFDVVPDHDLNLIRQRQTLTHVTVAALEGVGRLIEQERPQMVVVQGDTTTTFASSLAAFYRHVPVAHIEAGLRSGDRWSPYPEELNRQLTSRLAELHLCPTESSRDNLLAEAVDPAQVFVTGNTVIDALHWIVDSAGAAPAEQRDDGRRLVLVTAHRRESWDEGLAQLAAALRDVVEGRPDVRVLFPIHRNPVVREAMMPILEGLPNVEIVEPLPYDEFARAMAAAHVIVTDSGGVQEEAPSLGVPVLVTRRNTERPEAVEAGTVVLVGNDRDTVGKHLALLLDDPEEHARMTSAVNPYGDGHASERVIAALRHRLFGGPAPEPFRPS